MEQTAPQKEMQKTLKISAKQANEIKVSKQIAETLKRQWEDLAKRQQNSGIKMRADRRITSVTFKKDENGKIAVQVNMYGGQTIKDNGQEKALDRFKEQTRLSYVHARVAEFLRKIREYGYAAVEGEIPPELKEAVLKGMEKANISTSYKGRAAEAAEARQTLQNAAKAADNAAKAAKDASDMAKGFGAAGAADNAAKAMGAAIFGSLRKGTLDGDRLTFPSKNGEAPFSITATEDMKRVADEGTEFIIQDKPLNKERAEANFDSAAKSVAYLHEKFGNNQKDNIIYRRGNSVSYQSEEGEIRGNSFEIAPKIIVKKALTQALERLKEGEASEEDIKLIELHRETGVLNKDFAPNNLKSIDKAIQKVKRGNSNNFITNVEKLEMAGLEQLAQQVSSAKGTEREGRAICDKARRNELLAENNKRSQEKIALVKDLLGKEERHESLTDAEQKLLAHVHEQYDKILEPERLTSKTDLRQNEDALFGVLERRKLFGAIEHERNSKETHDKVNAGKLAKAENKTNLQPLDVSAGKSISDLTEQSRDNRKNGVEDKEDKLLMQYLDAVTKIYGADQITPETLEIAERLKQNKVNLGQLHGIARDDKLTLEQKLKETEELEKEARNKQLQSPVKESTVSKQKSKQPAEVEAGRVSEKLQENMKETPEQEKEKQAKQKEEKSAKGKEAKPKKSLQAQIKNAEAKQQTDSKDKSAALSDREKAAQAKIIAMKRKQDLAR